jgi:hypothetical protein
MNKRGNLPKILKNEGNIRMNTSITTDTGGEKLDGPSVYYRVRVFDM